MTRVVDIAALKRRNTTRFSAAKITRAPEFNAVARRLVAAKPRYQIVEQKTGVPWFIIAVIHERESSQSWIASIAQGDPWNRVSTHVPKGRGPFTSWEDAAIDALTNCHPYVARWKDWSSGGAMTLLEQYNGLGYAERNLPSPYVWSGTDQYERGKYVADGQFDPNAVDKQLGCAGLILAMQQLDHSISFTDTPVAQPPPDIEPAPKPVPKAPPVKETGGVVITGTAAGAAAHQAGMNWPVIIGVVLVAIALVALVIYFVKRNKPNVG